MPSICRSRRRLVSNSSKTPYISKNALPAALCDRLLGESHQDAEGLNPDGYRALRQPFI
jgi:hypothetical protein